MRGVAALVAGVLFGQTPSELGLSPEILLLARIKVKMEKDLARLPDYTCTQTIERSIRMTPSRRFRFVDALRLEVALVDGKELFAWPGSDQFHEDELRKIVPYGAIGNGAFGLHVHSVFLSSCPKYNYVGREQRNGRVCERFDYNVARTGSGYRLRAGDRSAIVAYHGSFWVETESLDLVRLEVYADQIPFDLDLASAGVEIDYERVEIGEGNFVLPSRAAIVLEDFRGNLSRNDTRFSRCRQYAGESFLTFDDPPPRELSPAAVTEAIELPDGLAINLSLATSLQLRTTAIGDPLAATVQSNVKRNGQVIVPKGATAKGRLVAFENLVADYWEIAIRLETIEFDNRRARVVAELEDFSSFALGGGRASMTLNFPGVLIRSTREPKRTPGVGYFYVKGGMIELPRGMRMIWRTLNSTADEKEK